MHRNLIVSLGVLLATVLGPASARAGKWEADAAHSRVGFSVRHMMISNVRGEFGSFTISADGDPKDAAKAKLEVVIEAGSIDTRNDKRDGHLKSPDFFDAAKFPSLRFVSKKIMPMGKGRLRVLGSLTIRGVTKDVALEVSGLSAPVKDPSGMLRLGAQATATISRKDFGLTWNKALEAGGVLVGDPVAITIEAELVQKK